MHFPTISIFFGIILGVLTIHRFGHQSGRGERSGGLSAAKIHDFSARVFLDRSQTSKNNKKAQKIRPDIQNTGQDIQSWFFEVDLKTFSWKSEMKNGVQGQTYLDR